MWTRGEQDRLAFLWSPSWGAAQAHA